MNRLDPPKLSPPDPPGVRYAQVEPRLTITQQYRLIEIAHETTYHDIRQAAMNVLDQWNSEIRAREEW